MTGALGGGLACVLASLALSPMVVYGAWASVDSRLHEGETFGDRIWLKDHSWVFWCGAAAVVGLFVADAFMVECKLLLVFQVLQVMRRL